MEGLYLYMNIHTPVYYPVNYVEIERSRDVFVGSREEAESVIRRMAVKQKCGALRLELWLWGPLSAESAVNHRQADVETTSPLSPR